MVTPPPSSVPPVPSVTGATPATFAEVLAGRVREAAAQPLVTAYDDRSGERTELSALTYANWVAKTANLLTDELMLDTGATVLLDLPPHWLGPVFLGAAWSAGLAVTTDPAVQHDLLVGGPERAGDPADRDRASGPVPVLACALLPFGVRFPEPLTGGVLDYGLLWPGQSDHFVASEPVTGDDVAWRSAPGEVTQRALLARAAGLGTPNGTRLITDLDPLAEQGVPAFLAPLLAAGSLVLVRHADPDRWSARHRDERATAELRSS